MKQPIAIECYEDIYRLFTSANHLGVSGVAPGMPFSRAVELWGEPSERRDDAATGTSGMTWVLPMKLKHGTAEDAASIGVQGKTSQGAISMVQVRVETRALLLPAVADAIEKRLKEIFGKPTGPKTGQEWTSLPSGPVSRMLLARTKKDTSVAIVLGGA